MTFLHIAALKKSYGPVTAVNDVDLSIPTGSRTAIVGPSGCGKTTLLRLIAGFEQPDAGEIWLDGHQLAGAHQQVAAHRRGIGIVAQDGCLFPHLTIAENIGFGLTQESRTKTGRVHELMDMVGLDRAMFSRKPDQLSGGQQQRVALARALAPRPRLMLLDEPFSALDTGLRASTRKAVADVLSSAGMTAVLVTHDQAEALAFADQVAVMRNGGFAQTGTPYEVYSRPRDEMTALFLGEAIVLNATVADGLASCALGDLAVDDRSAKGRFDIMLRPEQIDIHVMPHGTGTADATGTITDIEFCGATYQLSIRLHKSGDTHPDIKLSLPTRSLLARGDQVGVNVAGPAHIFR